MAATYRKQNFMELFLCAYVLVSTRQSAQLHKLGLVSSAIWLGCINYGLMASQCHFLLGETFLHNSNRYLSSNNSARIFITDANVVIVLDLTL